MIGLDTNVLIRWITGDEPILYRKVEKFLTDNREESFYLSTVVILEVWWVLNKVYEFSEDQVANVLKDLILSKEIEVERQTVLLKTLDQLANSPADFEDCLISFIHLEDGCTFTATFDKKAVKLQGMRLII